MKVDVSKIDGFNEMTLEDQVKALTEYEFEVPTPDTGNEEKLKIALSKANAQANEWKKQYKEKLTEAERAEADRAEAEKAMREELETLRREQSVSKLEAQYLAAGYSAEMATASAKASVDGDTATVLRIQTEFIEETKKNLEAAALGKQPGLSVGQPPKAVTGDDKIVDIAMHYAGL